MRTTRVLRRVVLAATAALTCGLLLAACGGSSSSSTQPSASAGGGGDGGSSGGKQYTIYLSNNFLGNDWRQQMERTTKIAASKPPLSGRVDLQVENAENTVQAQIDSLNNIIRQRPDAIVVDAASASALNPTIARACQQGITVVAFDQSVTAPCAYNMVSNWDEIPKVLGTWVAEQIGGKGTVFLDRGLPGAPISAQILNGYKAALKRYPNIKVAGYFNGQYALGPEQTGVSSLLAGHPDVTAILTQGYGTGAIKALKQAGHQLVPISAFSYNGTAVTCVKEKVPCIMGSNAPYLGADAVKLAVDILDGKKPAQKTVYSSTPYYATKVTKVPGFANAKLDELQLGTNAFPNLPPGLTLPIAPDWVQISPQEAAGSSS